MTGGQCQWQERSPDSGRWGGEKHDKANAIHARAHIHIHLHLNLYITNNNNDLRTFFVLV